MNFSVKLGKKNQKYFFLLFEKAKLELFVILCANLNYLAVYMKPKCEFLGSIRTKLDLWLQRLRSTLRIFKKCFLLLIIKTQKQLWGILVQIDIFWLHLWSQNVSFWVKQGQNLTFDLSCMGHFCEFSNNHIFHF